MYSAFLCHATRDSEFVIRVGQLLKRNLSDVFYYQEHQRTDRSFEQTINEQLENCQVMVIFLGAEFSKWQREEVQGAHGLHMTGQTKQFCIVVLADSQGNPYPLPTALNLLRNFPTINSPTTDQAGAFEVASQIVTTHLKLPWVSADDLPLEPHLFDYEKHIIRFYTEKLRLGDELYQPPQTGSESENREEERKREAMQKKILNGCPVEWPKVEVLDLPRRTTNKLDPDAVGTWRDDHARVVAAALSSHHKCDDWPGEECDNCMLTRGLWLPEAGPREKLCFSGARGLRAAVLVSGGIAPGINAVIDGIVQRHWMYAKAHRNQRGLRVYGLQNGFQAFDDFMESHHLLVPYDRGLDKQLVTTTHANEGGSILGTSRVQELLDPNSRLSALEHIVEQLRAHNVDVLYIIGGDGSMKAAHALWSVANGQGKRPLSVVAIPKTMDNDILWVWQAFGFLSAVEKARECIEQLHTEVISNPRLCILQLFGSDSGFVVSHAVVASATGHCDVALIPEVPFSMRGLAKYLKKKMHEAERRVPYGLVVMAETAIPTDAMEYVDPEDDLHEIGLSDAEKREIREFEDRRKSGRRIEGQTSDELRTAGSKIVSRGLAKLLPGIRVRARGDVAPEWTKLRVFTNEPRHLLRSIRPSCSDVIMGQRLGTLAVDNAMAGYTDFMISQWLTEYVLVPLKLVVLGRKRIPEFGIFWKSVRAKTGQDGKM
ncbi:MAG TPA: 6-phosphofructokinase [Thermoguttaceae bacterium]|nr:6-phosphofructokinase [Thermoguttaceae bacterium]